MTLIDAIKAYNKSPKDPAARGALLAIVGNKAIFKPGTKFNPADAEQALEFLNDLDADRASGGRYKDYQTLAEYEGSAKKGLDADPSADGVALDPHGISQDAAEIDWSGVSRERRLLVIHGRDIGKIAKNPDPETRQRWAGELSDPPNATLGGQWAKIADSLRALRASEREALEDRLVYRRRVEQPTPSALPAPVGPSATAAMHIGGSVSGSTIVTGNGNVVGQVSANAVKAFVLFDSADARFIQPLKTHGCGGMVRNGMLTISSIADCPPGAITSNWITSHFNAADVVLWLNSSDFLGNADLMSWLNFARGASKRLVPVSVRQTYEIPFGLVAIPRDKPIARYGDVDEAWCTVSQELRSVVESIRKAKGG